MNRPAAARSRPALAPPQRVMTDASEPPDDELDGRTATYAAVADAVADSTVRTYAWAWKRFETWCETTGHSALPASPHTISRFLVALADDPHKPVATSTVEVLRAAIARKHRDAGFADPAADPSARKIRRGIRKAKEKPGETSHRASATVAADIEAMVETALANAHTWRQQVAARRDLALILLGYDFGRRRGELVGLKLGDLSLVEDNVEQRRLLRIRLRGNQTRQGSMEYIYRPCGTRDAYTCPGCALARWIAVLTAADEAASAAHGCDAEAVTDAVSIAVQRLLRRDTRDPREHCCDGNWISGRARAYLFRPLSNGGLPHAPDTALSSRSVGSIVNARATAAGLGPCRGHSLRAGVATQMFDDGATVEEVMALLGHKRPETSLRYARRRQDTAEVDPDL